MKNHLPPWRTEHLRLAVEAARVALWSWNVDTNRFRMDDRSFELWGLPPTGEVEFEELSAHIHPADRDRVRAAFEATRSLTGSYEIDFRIMLEDEVRWISARGQGADAEILDRTTYGVFIDVTGRKQAEEGNELLAGEMSHRVKNLLSIAAGLAELTSRSSSTITEMTKQLTDRLASLGRAHDLIRPIPGNEGKAALLGDLLSVLLAPYDDTAAFSGRIRVSVPRMGIGESSTTVLAMVVHELATNSVKHGALSLAAGSLDISLSAEDDDVILTWTETGGPEIDGAPELTGFGSRMIARSITRQLQGSIAYDWKPKGVVVTVRVRRDRLTK